MNRRSRPRPISAWGCCWRGETGRARRLCTTGQRLRDGPTTPISVSISRWRWRRSATYQHALDELDAAARLRPADPTAHLIAGKLLLTQSRPGDAWKRYERALAIQPNNVDALLGSGLALTQLQRPDEAIEKYRLALKVDPRNADAQEALERTQALRDGQRK